jgi:hypothetical protein
VDVRGIRAQRRTGFRTTTPCAAVRRRAGSAFRRTRRQQLLAAWSDRRSYTPDASGFFDFETSGDIYAMRLDAAGNPLDTVPIVVTQGKANQQRPRNRLERHQLVVVYESIPPGRHRLLLRGGDGGRARLTERTGARPRNPS